MGLGGEINYRYKYKDQDLLTLKKRLGALLERGNEVYTLFNNFSMFKVPYDSMI